MAVKDVHVHVDRARHMNTENAMVPTHRDVACRNPETEQNSIKRICGPAMRLGNYTIVGCAFLMADAATRKVHVRS